MKLTPKGMRDILPEDMIIREDVKKRITEIYQNYGYRPLDTPAMEYLDTLRMKAGEDVNNQIFVLEGERLGLRFDLTVPLARVAANSDLTKPFKRYCIGPVWRREEPQKGRYREFWQADVDIIGSKSMRCEAELLHLAVEVCQKFGFDKPKILLNNRKILDTLSSKLGFDNEKEEVFRILDKIDKIGYAEVEGQLRGFLGDRVEEFLSYIKSGNRNNEKLDSIREISPEGSAELDQILLMCDFDIEIDLSLVRGLGYYTGPIFEIKLSDDIGTVMAGGRYDHLMEVYGQSDPAVGVSIGIERLIVLLSERQKKRHSRTDAFVGCAKTEYYAYSLQVASELRKYGIRVETDLKGRNLRKQFEYVNSLAIPFMVILGQREKESGKVTFKEMESGYESLISIDEAAELIRRGCSA